MCTPFVTDVAVNFAKILVAALEATLLYFVWNVVTAGDDPLAHSKHRLLDIRIYLLDPFR